LRQVGTQLRYKYNFEFNVFLTDSNFNKCVLSDLTEDELWAAFEGCGQIESVRIVKDVHTYKSRGLGYVNFKSASSVELALKMDNSEIKNRPIRVHRCGSVQSAQGKSGKKPKKKFRKREQATGQQSDSVFSGKQAVTLKKKKVSRVNIFCLFQIIIPEIALFMDIP